ncbi:hypothetical protein CXB51_004541 [Gossypium anomalum]|uniref:DUF4283 domain-containing protein n=1 Tax=Gossypium anomalum TaxID=47600 RepID=A0A8J5ZGA9_9ROSI|nr:hypothetical protein CXB51_004541 [Gossypium anomalum]
MRNTLANLWHPLRGIEILNMVEKCFLFRFFHWVDIEILMKGVPCTFNNHLLVFHRLGNIEDSLLVPLFYSYFWVQAHDLPPDFYSKEVYETLTFCFLCGFLRQSNSFFPTWFKMDVNEVEVGWDISLRALPSREGSVVGLVDDCLELDSGRVAKGFLVSEGISDISQVLGMNVKGRSKEGFERHGSSSIGFG